jgi:hypothetical protein
MSMTGARVLSTELGLVERPPPQAMVRETGLLHAIPAAHVRAAEEAAHWAYGALGGALFDVLPGPVRSRRWAGPLYGLALWLGYEAAIAPLLGLRHAQEPRPVERLAFAADHLLYGVVVGHR